MASRIFRPGAPDVCVLTCAPGAAFVTGNDQGNNSETVKQSALFAFIAGMALLILPAHPARATNRSVTNLNDSGAGSLRDTIAASANGDTINFNVTGTIALTSGELVVSHSISIFGPGANLLSVSATHALFFRVFRIASGTVTISGLTISGGELHNPDSQGGGIYNNATLSLISCEISSNSVVNAGAVNAGGGVYNNGTLTMLDCLVLSNSAGPNAPGVGVGYGGAIYNNGTLATTNCIFYGNGVITEGGTFPTGAAGGAIYAAAGNTTMTNCTLSTNYAYVSGSSFNALGGGVYQTSPAVVKMLNTIVSGNVLQVNTGGNALGPDVRGAVVSQGHNLIGNTNDSSGWIASDKTNGAAAPLRLGQYQYFGGTLPTYPLLVGSAAIDAGDDSVTGPPLNLTTDQRGVGSPRRRGAHVDIGAFEFNPTFIVTTGSDGNDGACDSTCTLREAITDANADPSSSTITFSFGLSTIQLASALPNLSTNMTIQGPGVSVLTVRRDTGGNYRVFTVNNGKTTGPTVVLSGLTISNGLAPGASSLPDSAGGGILCEYGALTITNCIVTSNTARYGGGVANFSGALSINTSTLIGNVSTTDGGGIYNYGGDGGSNLIVTYSTLNGNTANGDSGGGIENYGGVITVENCTFYNNTAFNAGAIDNNGNGLSSTATVRSSTFSLNSTAAAGGADITNAVFFGGSAMLTLSSDIFKTGAQGANLSNINGTLISQGHNLSNDAAGGNASTGPGGFLNGTGDMRNTDPLLGTLANNGGPTLTIALLAGSPAINNGGSLPPMQDQRYYRRSGTADIGAYESNGTLGPVVAVSRKTHGASDFDIGLPLTGTAGIECRSGGATNDHLLVVTFPTPVTVSSAQVTTGSGNASALDNDSLGHLTIHLTGVANAQQIVTTLFNVNDGVNSANVAIPMGILLGDTSGSGTVNATDVSLTKSKSGQAVDATNFRNDVSVNGSINASDVSTVKLSSGTALPPAIQSSDFGSLPGLNGK